MILKVKKLTPDAVLPSFAHPGDAGMDLFANETVTLKPGEIGKIKSGVSMEIPDGYVGLYWDKSGLSNNHGIKMLGGVVDSGYRGELIMGVINLGKESYTFEKGHKVLQMLIQKVERPEIMEVEELTDTSRGTGGFGSTGK
ncbi:MAG TPA: dUTP diphosphatase [Candidatus Paceibacterota bacterium]